MSYIQMGDKGVSVGSVSCKNYFMSGKIKELNKDKTSMAPPLLSLFSQSPTYLNVGGVGYVYDALTALPCQGNLSLICCRPPSRCKEEGTWSQGVGHVHMHLHAHYYI